MSWMVSIGAAIRLAIDWGQSPIGRFDLFRDCPRTAHFGPNKPVPNSPLVPLLVNVTVASLQPASTNNVNKDNNRNTNRFKITTSHIYIRVLPEPILLELLTC
jgi:hypothetical protein